MSSEPERPIEKLLRDCAKERREQAGDSWELHPANRRLLQQAVAKQFCPAGKPIPWWRQNWFGLPWWMGAVSGLATLAVLAAGFWLVVPRHGPANNPTLLARNDQNTTPAAADKLSSLRSEAVDEKTRAFQPSGARNIIKEEENLPTPRDSADKDLAQAAAPALQKTAPAEKMAEAEYDRRPLTLADSVNSAAPGPTAEPLMRQRYASSPQALPPAAAAPPSPSLNTALSGAEPQQASTQEHLAFSVPAGSLSQPISTTQPTTLASTPGSLSVSQPTDDPVLNYGYFAGTQTLGRQNAAFDQAGQSAAADDSKKKADVGGAMPPTVLSYFQIEQSGPELRITDSDGSVYKGSLQAAAVPASTPVSARTASATAAQDFRAAKQQNNVARSAPAKEVQFNEATAAGSFAFQVVGTNRTYQQRVVFSGVITGLTNAIASSRNERQLTLRVQQERVAVNDAEAQSKLQQNLRAQNAHVFGKALIGSGEPFNIEAAAAPAPP